MESSALLLSTEVMTISTQYTLYRHSVCILTSIILKSSALMESEIENKIDRSTESNEWISVDNLASQSIQMRLFVCFEKFSGML